MTDSYGCNLCEMGMDYRLERQIWTLAHQGLPNVEFDALITKAVHNYKRRPGLHQLDRVYAKDIGLNGMKL
ncbi:hypothetical protein [Pseudomonas sp. R3-56]|uniref:hypothetical protein n=1 Tax=Pseudomonas sp. R3-56 TaxID=2817401 RepID=UPI003DA7D8D6